MYDRAAVIAGFTISAEHAGITYTLAVILFCLAILPLFNFIGEVIAYGYITMSMKKNKKPLTQNAILLYALTMVINAGIAI
ncbi:hypothetical protein [Petroclostridium sp. X23]|uniref:hypothetical protein n=1 Tax=Petroclostridium sp. X23 TaxID=3045146 RepID=UPI0024AE0255|nr:hypothetical protein [Petroclostridium sp. X23]WHH58264.1 hypothetical protein QKW49_21070 [Petroclostridium sp. X23]